MSKSRLSIVESESQAAAAAARVGARSAVSVPGLFQG